jgi:branched-chain amino acid transport system substrate-binding protein
VYYTNMKATLDALDAVKGDLSDGHKKYREAMAKMTLKLPTGEHKLDANRQAIGSTFITEVVKDKQGNLFNKVLHRVDNVNQTLGTPPAEFKIGSRDEPNCP